MNLLERLTARVTFRSGLIIPGALTCLALSSTPAQRVDLAASAASGPLTDPTAYGGRAEDAFDVVIPSLPGYGYQDGHCAAWEHPALFAAELRAAFAALR